VIAHQAGAVVPQTLSQPADVGQNGQSMCRKGVEAHAEKDIALSEREIALHERDIAHSERDFACHERDLACAKGFIS
jgi:hypothetical protein